jgi:hypothetical protein
MPSQESKLIRLRTEDHTILEEIRLEVGMERGVSSISIPQLIMEMAKFYQENRKK